MEAFRLMSLCDHLQISRKDLYGVIYEEGRKTLWAKNSQYCSLFKDTVFFQGWGQ